MLLEAVSAGAQAPPTSTHWTATPMGDVFLSPKTPPPDWDGPAVRQLERRLEQGQSFPVELSGLPAGNEQLTASSVSSLRREPESRVRRVVRDDEEPASHLRTARRLCRGMNRSATATTFRLWRRYQLAVHDVGPKYIRALKTEATTSSRSTTSRRAKTHGVTIEYIRGIKGEGFRNATLGRSCAHSTTASRQSTSRR